MNIYNFHSEPETLLHHDIANETIPTLFWKKYRDNQEELKKREKYIAKDGYFSYYYARYILKKPFQIGEKAISKYAYNVFNYAFYVLKGPFPAGEETISKNAYFAYSYALDILKKAFPFGEKVISKDNWYIKKYLKLLSDKEQQEFKKKYV